MIVETAFYSWIIIILKYFFYNGVGIDAQSLISAFLPISYNVYWFVSAYVGMYILFPVVNLLVHGITRKQHLGVILILVSYFSLWNSVIPFSQPMGINRFGYSVIWFLVLYLIAAYIRLYVTNFSTKKICLFFILTIAFINFSWLALSLVGIMLGISISNVFTEYYYHYNSFPVLIASVSFFLLFKNVCIKSDVIRKIIRFASPLCFGVYLIHDNPNIRDIVWSFLPQYETLSISYPFVVAFYALAIFIGCLFIDYFRSVLFGIINRREWYKALLAKADAFVYSAYNVITSRLLNR
jgi:surface polysaccharide O-acyltransferase-like enzyme